MRSSILLLAIAVSLSAVEQRSLAELSGYTWEDRQEDTTSHPFLLRMGAQQLSGSSDGLLNTRKYSVPDQTGYRTHAEVLMLVQPSVSRPALMLGLGGSRTAWDLGSNVELVASHISVLGGLAMALSPSNLWRVELLGHAGAGRGTLGSDTVRGRAREYGIDAGLVFPVVPEWRLEGIATVGWYHSKFEPNDFNVVKYGVSLPVDINFETDGWASGLALTWRP